MTDLKPCPFCGKLPSTYRWAEHYSCESDCPLNGTVFKESTWNHRPIEDALRTEVERLEIQLDKHSSCAFPGTHEEREAINNATIEFDAIYAGRFWTESTLDIIRRAGIAELEVNRLTTINEKLRQAECPECKRSLPPDGDCHGCRADKLERELASLKSRIDGAAVIEFIESSIAVYPIVNDGKYRLVPVDKE